jgi:hypothetical protein
MPTSAGGTPFELVEDGPGRYGAYRGKDRRRIRPRVGVSEHLTEARRGVWAAAVVRVVLVVVVWSLTAAPALHASHPMAALLCPLGYLLLEGTGLALVLAYLTGVARAASKY